MTQIKKHNFPQRSEAWEKIRVGKIGGSQAISLSTHARQKSIIPLKLAEKLTGFQEDVFLSEAMSYGIDSEPIVVDLYEKETFIEVDIVGYVTNSDYKYLGLSPDFLIGEDGAGEIKSPKPKAHVDTIINNKVPKIYEPQLAHYFIILPNLKWIDFISYNHHVKSKPYFKIRVLRNELQDVIDTQIKNYFEFERKFDEYLKLFTTPKI